MGQVTNEAGTRLLASRGRDAPTGPGVYLMVGADAELLYVGKAASLRRRLLGHANSAPRGHERTDGPFVFICLHRSPGRMRFRMRSLSPREGCDYRRPCTALRHRSIR